MSDESPRYIDHELLAAIDQFIAEHPGMTASAFGTQSINDPALVSDLREGRELRRATRERILAFIGADPRGANQPRSAVDSNDLSASCRKSLGSSTTSTNEVAAE